MNKEETHVDYENDEEEGGNLILPQQTPNGFRMALYSVNTAYNKYCNIKDGKSSFSFR